VDRALALFVSEELDLAIATLPEGLDPCDLLMQQGPEPFRQALANAVNVLDFKLSRVLAGEAAAGVEGKRRAVDAVLGIIALAPERQKRADAMKRELVVTHIAHRLGLKEEILWALLNELREARRRGDTEARRPPGEAGGEPRQAPAAAIERELLQVLLAEPALVLRAATEVAPEDVQHPGLRQLLDGLYRLHAEGTTPDLDGVRPSLDNPRLADYALRMQEVGRLMPDRQAALEQLLKAFRTRREQSKKRELQNQLAGTLEHAQAVELLRQLQEPN
jgi:DNA primase